jgi:hypothetical protein
MELHTRCLWLHQSCHQLLHQLCQGEDRATYYHGMQNHQLMTDRRDLCGFVPGQDRTIKGVDEEGDPGTVQSQTELDEAIRLYEVHKWAELTGHVFPGRPPAAGQLHQGEDSSTYRHGARRGREMYKVKGHIFQTERFDRKVLEIKVLLLVSEVELGSHESPPGEEGGETPHASRLHSTRHRLKLINFHPGSVCKSGGPASLQIC